MVVNIPKWPYNALMGRPFLNEIRAVTATYCLKIKFPTEFGTGEVKGCQETARKANLSTFTHKEVEEVFQLDESSIAEGKS